MNRRKPVKTLNSPLDAAEICRRNGWRKGTRLIGEEDGVPETIQITAIGEWEILTKVVKGVGSDHFCEWIQDLSCRQWKRATK